MSPTMPHPKTVDLIMHVAPVISGVLHKAFDGVNNDDVQASVKEEQLYILLVHELH